jgi:CDP-paratose 2-epimerase
VSLAVITGSTGLVGSEAASYFGGLGMDVIGIDNDMRQVFFGSEASTAWNQSRLEKALGGRYSHHSVDIRDREGVDEIFARHGKTIELVIHTPRNRHTTGQRSSRSPTSTSTRSAH